MFLWNIVKFIKQRQFLLYAGRVTLETLNSCGIFFVVFQGWRVTVDKVEDYEGVHPLNVVRIIVQREENMRKDRREDFFFLVFLNKVERNMLDTYSTTPFSGFSFV